MFHGGKLVTISPPPSPLPHSPPHPPFFSFPLFSFTEFFFSCTHVYQSGSQQEIHDILELKWFE